MMNMTVVRRLKVAGIVFAVLTGGGCREKPRNFTPTLSVAEEALRRGLDAWKSGLPVGEVAGQPGVYVFDGGRKPGQTLESYQILGEVQGSTGRTVAVALRLANPEEEIKDRYVIIGIDPLWVYRQEDYELLMHWEHRMPAQKSPDQTDSDDVAQTKQESVPVPEELPADALSVVPVD